mmetsp:Transcript_62688/g.136142  ORF Transcript_62688/g.136142 Transcript_62688/m.136142 type:complete len:401 (-) Transcript_62688:78-1280(-)
MAPAAAAAEDGASVAPASAGLDFPAPIVELDAVNGTALFLRVAGEWPRGAPLPTWAWPCVAVVPSPADCTESAFPRRPYCAARAMWGLHSPEAGFLGFELRRPTFTVGPDMPPGPSSHSVCLRPPGSPSGKNQAIVVLGRLVYYPLPKLGFDNTVPVVSVRTFLNPGWKRELRLECKNCSRVNLVAIRPVDPHVHCSELPAEVAALDRVTGMSALTSAPLKPLFARTWTRPASQEHCLPPPAGGPCSGYAEDAFDSAGLVQGDSVASWAPYTGDSATFVLQSNQRLSSSQLRSILHRRSAVCFYSDAFQPRGWLAGYVSFHTNGPDVQAFVGFLCFFGFAMPLICMLTVRLHLGKHQRCQQHLLEMRLGHQREQLQTELGDRRTPLAQRGSSQGSSAAAA